MASGQDIRITDVPFSSVPSTVSTVFINDNGKLRQTDLTTIAKYSELYTAIIEAHNTGLQSLETTKTQLEQALVDLTNEKFEIINKDHAENLAELTALYENSVQNINALIENGHDKLLNDIAAVDDLRIKVAELNNNLITSNGLQFKFSTDGEGNYGYLGADDSFVPFKSGVTGGTIVDSDTKAGSYATILSKTISLEKGTYIIVATCASGNNSNPVDGEITLCGIELSRVQAKEETSQYGSVDIITATNLLILDKTENVSIYVKGNGTPYNNSGVTYSVIKLT